MCEVVYYAVDGNTRTAAEAVAKKLGTAARDIKSMETLDEDSIIFLGPGCRGSVHWLDTSSFLWIETSGKEEEKPSSLPRRRLTEVNSAQ
jgi:hypothetical protein